MYTKQIFNIGASIFRIRLVLIVAAAALGFIVSAVAVTTVDAATCGGVETTLLDCQEGKKDGGAVWGILRIVINVLTLGIGIAAVGGLIYGAILWTTAADNSSQITKSKEVIFNVVLGLVLYALMYSFLQFIIPGGVFNA